MGLVLITPPAIQPLTVAEVKAHLRLDSASGEPAPVAPNAALAAVTPGNVDNGAHRYLVTFVTAEGETEAGISTAPITVANKTIAGKINLSAIPTGGAAVTARKIYRTIAGGVSYLLLTTLNDNTTTVYVDDTADASLGASAPAVNTTEDPYLLALIAVATATAEDKTKRRFISQDWDFTLDRFPARRVIELMLPKLIEVLEITYVDTDGDEQTLDADTYQVSLTGDRGRVCLKPDEAWPDTYSQLDAVRISMRVGYGSARSDVPAALRQAMLLWIGHWYNVREDVIVGTIVADTPKAADYLISPYVSQEF